MSCVKITSSRYAYLKSLRNNEPNLQLRYLVIQRDIKNPQMLADFVELFNDYLSGFSVMFFLACLGGFLLIKNKGEMPNNGVEQMPRKLTQ